MSSTAKLGPSAAAWCDGPPDGAAQIDDKETHEHLRTACIHEAGHAIVARHLGLAVDACVEINESWSPGQPRYGGFVGTANRLEEHIEDPEQRQLVRLAGIAAEALVKDVDCTGALLCDCLDRRKIRLDESDGKDGYSAAALDKCLSLLRTHWREVELLSDRLEYTTDGSVIPVIPDPDSG